MSLAKAQELLDVAANIQVEEDNLGLSLVTTRLALREVIRHLQSSKPKVNENE